MGVYGWLFAHAFGCALPDGRFDWRVGWFGMCVGDVGAEQVFGEAAESAVRFYRDFLLRLPFLEEHGC